VYFLLAVEKTDPSKIISSEVIETYGTFTGKYSLQYITDDLIILVRHYANFHSTERQRKSILICYRATLRYCGYRPNAIGNSNYHLGYHSGTFIPQFTRYYTRIPRYTNNLKIS